MDPKELPELRLNPGNKIDPEVVVDSPSEETVVVCAELVVVPKAEEPNEKPVLPPDEVELGNPN